MRRPRSFWEARVAELARGRRIERVAEQHGVRIDRLRWWRWRLASDAQTESPRLVEVVTARPQPAAVADVALIRLLVGDALVELPPGTSPEFIGRLLSSLRATC